MTTTRKYSAADRRRMNELIGGMVQELLTAFEGGLDGVTVDFIVTRTAGEAYYMGLEPAHVRNVAARLSFMTLDNAQHSMGNELDKVLADLDRDHVGNDPEEEGAYDRALKEEVELLKQAVKLLAQRIKNT